MSIFSFARKTEPDGRTWTYTYSGNGMLAEVTRPDRSCVRFKYDALGRRTEKSVTGGYSGNASGKHKEKVVKFLWDGNTPLHEWEEERTTDSIPVLQPVADYKADFLVKLEKRAEEKARKEAEKGQEPPENLVTWVFGDGFVPRAKITKDGCYSIISDYLGTPVEAYDGNGNKVWERELDIYGRVKTGKNETGERNFIPFRFQGQYEDKETGLYYNRFRYYSPEEGCYTQQDPIGLAGGNPTLYGYVFNTLWEFDPFGLTDFSKMSNNELINKLGELAYNNKRLPGSNGAHGVVHRIREQITGKMRPPDPGWYTHDEQIQIGLRRLREGLNEARNRGLSDIVNKEYPNINKVASLDPPKPTDTKVPKGCR